jgi:hypothetical protein
MNNAIVKCISLFVCLSFNSVSVFSQNLDSLMKNILTEQSKSMWFSPKTYHCHKASAAIKVDGNLDEKSWKTAAWTDLFVDIEGDRKPKPQYATKVKMLWDSAYFYLAAQLDDDHIWAYLKNHDEIVFYDNDFEVFIDTDNDAKNYFEIEINALETVFDLFINQPYRIGAFPLHVWNCEGLLKKVKVNGSINNGKDKDKSWIIEMAIPLRDLSPNQKVRPFNNGDFWRVNFSRVEWDTELVNGKYVKLKDPATGKPKPENNWCWSPQGQINMHAPERWGYVFFVDEASKSVDVKIPDQEAEKRLLWLIYHLEKSFYHKNGKYTTDASELLPELSGLLMSINDYYSLEIKVLDNYFHIYLTNIGTGKILSFNSLENFY